MRDYDVRAGGKKHRKALINVLSLSSVVYFENLVDP